MAEQLINEFTVNRPIEEAWPIITDVEKIAPCLPGAELQEVAQDDDKGEIYRGVVKVKLGPISTKFKGDAHFIEKDDEHYRAVLKGNGRETGGRGNASADISAHAESLSPTSTKVVVSTDLHITGKVAQFGRGILGDVSSKLIDQFAANLNTMIDEDGLDSNDDVDESSDTASDTAPDTAPDITSDTAPATNDEPVAADAGESAKPAAANSDPSVRKINGPAAQPIDLMDVTGGSIVKRAAPVVAALLLVLYFLRRRS